MSDPELLSKTIVHDVAALHLELLDQGFITTLGFEFLCLIYYAINEDPDSKLIVRLDNFGKVIGFVAGGLSLRGIYKLLLKNPLALGWSLRASVFSMGALRGIFEIIVRSFLAALCGHHSGEGSKLPAAELYFIAVNPAHHGEGVATGLYEDLKRELNCLGADAFRILVGESLARAHAFYIKMGARPVESVALHSGNTSIVYVQTTQ